MLKLEVLFMLVTLLSLLSFSLAIEHDKRVIILFGTWFLVIGLLSILGFFENTSALPPRFVFVLLPASALVIIAYRSLTNKPVLAWLIAVHMVRIPVELILFELYGQGLVPRAMTFQGWNYDILSGITAGVALFLYVAGRLNRWVLLFWNGIALILLLIIVVTAALSVPTPIQQLAFDQPNTAVLRFPFTWLPAVIVPVVFLSHLLIFRMAYAPQHIRRGLI
ncbi:MAG: hypothetical protein AAGA85_17605 [Bacteroidota bacterium]